MSAYTLMLEDPSDNIREGKFSQVERLLETYFPGSRAPPTFLPLWSNTAAPELAMKHHVSENTTRKIRVE